MQMPPFLDSYFIRIIRTNAQYSMNHLELTKLGYHMLDHFTRVDYQRIESCIEVSSRDSEMEAKSWLVLFHMITHVTRSAETTFWLL